MNTVGKKFKYALQIFPLMVAVENWWEIIFSFINSGVPRILRMRKGANFIIKHHIDALTILEVYEVKEYDVKLTNPKVIIDIGANIGTTSVFFSKKYPNCHIYSYEPAEATFKLLRLNLLINDVSNVVAHKFGISGNSGKLAFYIHPASGLSSVYKKRKGMKKVVIETRSLSRLFRSNRIIKCDLLKLDCEGSEYDVLFNLPKQFFNIIDNIVLEYHDNLTTKKHEELLTFLKKMGYKTKLKHSRFEDLTGIIYALK
jgi:FkbM family methyltransferase